MNGQSIWRNPVRARLDAGQPVFGLTITLISASDKRRSVEDQPWAPDGSSSSSPFSSAFLIFLVVISTIVVPIVILILIPAVEPLHGV